MSLKCRVKMCYNRYSEKLTKKLLVISVYDGGALIDSVILSDSGQMSMGGANYIMSGADEFIGEFIRLLDTTD